MTISYTRDNHYIFLAQSIWWISSVIGLQKDLVTYIDHLRVRLDIAKQVAPSSLLLESEQWSTSEGDIQDEILRNCEEFREHSRQETKAIGRRTFQTCQVVKRKARKQNEESVKTFETQTVGITGSEFWQRQAACECQRCAWPDHRKGAHKTNDCIRWIWKEEGTAPFPEAKQSQQLKAKDKRI